MKEALTDSVYFAIFISILGYEAGLLINKKLKLAIFNPLLTAIIFIIGLLTVLKIDYDTYNRGANLISMLLTPATVSLAVPLYEKLTILKKNFFAIMAGIFSGVIASAVTIYLLSVLYKLNHSQYVTLLPKSITTAIGIELSGENGGMEAITVAAIVITGIIGNVTAQTVLKIFKIKNPIAKGIAIGTSAHAMGTAKAVEMGETEGAMSGLAIAVAGILTVICMSVFAQFI